MTKMTKQEVFDLIRDFSETFPKEALKEIQANQSDFIPELLESLDYASHNAKELREAGSDYYMHTYAMYLLAEFREKRAFPKLLELLRLPADEIDFILGDGLTEGFSRLLLCTFDSERLQMLLDIIEDRDLYEWARLSAIIAYELLVEEDFVTREEMIATLRAFIYDKLSPDDSYVVFTGIAGNVIRSRLFDMLPDVRFLYDDDRVDRSVYGGYDDFLDWMFYKERPEPTYIDDAISEMERWACFKSADGNPKRDSFIPDNFADEIKKGIEKDRLAGEKKIKVGRNDPCPCGSGKKYKKCCMNKQQNNSSVARLEDKYDLLERYPKDSALFEQMYEKEAITIDMLAYKALHSRAIPLWVKRDLTQERIGKIDYLNEALSLFSDKCRREKITSFAAYDERYMVHYQSREWVTAMIDLIEEDDPARVKSIRQTAMDTLQSFS